MKEVLQREWPMGVDVLLTNRLVRGAIRLWWRAQPRHMVPPSDDPLLNMSAVRLSRMIRNGEITSAKLTRTLIDRIKFTQPLINAATEIFEIDAMEKATEIDSYVRKLDKSSTEFRELDRTKPLLGIPFTMKNSFNVKGKRVYCGLHHLATKAPADEDAEAVKRLRSAGAFPLANTNVPPALLAWESDNHIFGRTSSPYDTRCTSGGSSGGEGALLAAQGSIIGLGSDLGGSIRIPSILNCTFGLKPYQSAVPLDGHVPEFSPGGLREMGSIGPMCRYAEDVGVVFDVLTNHSLSDDRHELRPAKLLACPSLDTGLCQAPTPCMDAAFRNVVKFVEDECGLKASEYRFPPMKTVARMFQNLAHQQDGPQPFEELLLGKSGGSLYKEFARTMVGLTKFKCSGLMCAININKPIGREEHLRLNEQTAQFVADFYRSVDRESLLIMPAYPHNRYFHTETVPVLWDSAYTVVANVVAAPAMVVPLGLDENGYPLSVQLVAARGNEQLLINTARRLEQKFGGWKPPNVNTGNE